MGQPYVGEIRMFAGNFAPEGWMFCTGQLLPISEYETLFNLIGTTYGGDGQTTFGLPDLRSRIPIHQGAGFALAGTGGSESVTLTQNQVAAHSHALLASANAAQLSAGPNGNLLAAAGTTQLYGSAAPNVAMNPAAVGAATGGTQPHTNVAPYLCVSFIISLFGIFPSPS